MREIGKAVREGAMAFLSREYKVISIFVVVVAILLAVAYTRLDLRQQLLFWCVLLGSGHCFFE